MEQEIGKQYSKDKTRDRSGFLAEARLQQSTFRANVLKVPFDTFGSYLTKEDAENGLNFYSELGTVKEVKERFPEYNKTVYADMLRSEHLGFNLFAPFKEDFSYAKEVLNQFLSIKIASIEQINFAYAPSPSNRFLDDQTQFDVCVEYTDTNSDNCLIGVTINFTENDFFLKTNSKEALAIKNEKSRYHQVSNNCGIYKPEALTSLSEDTFRETWKHQLLGERILFKDADKFKRFTSLVIFPKGNTIYAQTSIDYSQKLNANNDKFVPVTLESFIENCKENSPNEDFNNWINYLVDRYIAQG